MRRLIRSGFVVAYLAVAAVALGKKTKQTTTPWGLWKPLVTAQASWTLLPRTGDKSEAKLIVETYDVRKVGDADVARLRWTLVHNGNKQEKIEQGGLPTQVAVTAKGAYLLSADDGDEKIAMSLKKPPPYGDPPAEIDSTKHRDPKSVTHRNTKQGKIVCIGYGPTKGAGECENVCFGDFCISPEKGLVLIEGTYSPGDDDYAQSGFE